MRRLLLVLLVVVVLAIVGLIAAQAVLMSDLPRRIVVAELQDRLGLNVHIDDLTARWSGHAEARGVRVTLPLETTPFLEAPVLRLKHTSLLRIVLTREVEVESIAVDQPVLRVVQRPEGHWNLQQVQEVLAANLTDDASDRDPSGPLPIPEIDLRGVRLEIDRLNHDRVVLTDVTITGRRRAPLAYQFDADLPRVGTAEARFSRAAPYSHEVAFDFAPGRKLVGDLFGEPASPRLAGLWRGRITGQILRGTLDLQEASVADVRLSGRSRLSGRTDSPTLTLEPVSLALAVDHPAVPEPLRLVGGRLEVTETDVQLQDVRIAGFDGQALVQGQFDLATLTGELNGMWEQLAFPAGFNHTGTIDVQLTRSGPTGRRVEATLNTQGRSGLGQWRGKLELTANGETYTDLTGTLTSRELRYEMRGHRYRFADLNIDFATNERSVRMTRFELGERDANTHITGQGVFDWIDRTWSATFDGRELPLPEPLPAVARLRFEASGDTEHVGLHEVEIKTLGMQMEARGGYAFDDPEPLKASVRLRQAPIHVGDDNLSLVQATNVSGELEVRGTLRPLALSAEGNLLTEGLQVHHDTLGDVALQVQARVDDEAATFEAQALEWLGGQWRVRGRYAMTDEKGRVYVDANDVDLTLVDRLTGGSLGVELGQVDLALEAEGMEHGPTGMRVNGRLTLRDIERGPMRAERVTGRVEMADGRLRVFDLLAMQDDGRASGEVALDLRRPSRLRFEMATDAWPIRLMGEGALMGRITGEADGEVDVANRVGDGEMKLSMNVAGGDGTGVGSVDVHMELADSMLRLRSLDGHMLRGEIHGSGQVDLADPWHTVALDVQWAELHPGELEPWLPVLRRMSGTLDGALYVEPTHDERSLGPVRAELTLEASDAAFHELPIGNGRATAYLAPTRMVLQEMMFDAMGGHIGAWGRVTQREGGRFGFVSTWLTNLDMEMISETLRPEASPLLGRLSASMSLSAPLNDWRNMFGTGSLTLRESDITAIPLISVLYDVLNIAIVGRSPEGRASGRFRLEEGMVLVERFWYQNRGATIRLAGRVEDVWAGLSSPFRGVASLSLAPLPDVEFLEVLNEAFTALQADATTVELTGRINEPDPPRVVPFRGVFDAVRRVLGIRSEDE